MMRRLALVLVCAGLLAPAAHATDYWVRPGGSDGADGRSLANAWATLIHAAATVGAGDTVHVQNGDYQGFDLRTAGTQTSPITFLAEGTAVRITADNPRTPDGINVEDASWVVIDGFDVENRTRAGIRTAVS